MNANIKNVNGSIVMSDNLRNFPEMIFVTKIIAIEMACIVAVAATEMKTWVEVRL